MIHGSHSPSQEFWKAESHKIHTFTRSRHHRKDWRFWRIGTRQGWGEISRGEWLLLVRWPTFEKGMFNYAPACQLVNNISWTPDCPQNVGGPLLPRTGANTTPTAPRNWGTNSYTGSWRDGDVYRKGVDRGPDGSDRYRRGVERPRDRSGWDDNGPGDRRRSPVRSRSRSPPPRRSIDHGSHRRERRRSRSVDSDNREKRRR